MTLKVDIYEPGKKKPKKLLASKGDPVTLIAEHDNMLIVQCKGRRISVNREDVSQS